MRKLLLIACLVFTVTFCKSQDCYYGMTADFNTGVGERYTYGLGLHTEFRCARTKNLYFNWHYSIGMNTHSEFYGHGGLSLLLYKSDDWWRAGTGTWEEFVGMLIGPIIIPNGVTYYFPQQQSAYKMKAFRFGVYCNPIAMDFWDSKPYKVTSWTIECGGKMLYETKAGPIWYFAGGVSFTNNMRRAGRTAGFGSEELVQIQIGLLTGG